MRERSVSSTREMLQVAEEVQLAAPWLLRYSLVLVIAWIGGMKFTALEAAGIQPLVGSSPFLSWMYRLWSVQVVSNLFGVAEISIATMIAVRPWAPKASALGSGLAVVMFVTTLSFLFSLPGWDSRLGGFPALSDAGGFLLKDTVLLGTALWSFGDSLAAISSHDSDPGFRVNV